MLNLPKADGRISKMCVELLKKRLYNQISEKDFDTEMVYVMLDPDVFSEIVPEHEPMPPQEIIELRNMKRNVKPEFWMQEHIKHYTSEVTRVRVGNMTKVEWLKDALTKLPAEDDPNRHKVSQRLIQFGVNIHDHKPHRLEMLNEK